jgi:hypothetical protein
MGPEAPHPQRHLRRHAGRAARHEFGIGDGRKPLIESSFALLRLWQEISDQRDEECRHEKGSGKHRNVLTNRAAALDSQRVHGRFKSPGRLV